MILNNNYKYLKKFMLRTFFYYLKLLILKITKFNYIIFYKAFLNFRILIL